MAVRSPIAVLSAILALASLLILGCDQGSLTQFLNQNLEPSSSGLMNPDLVVAEDRLGAIRFQDLDRFILALPIDQRWRASNGSSAWYEEIARRVSFTRLMHQEAMREGVDRSPELKTLHRGIARNAYSDAYLARLSSNLSISEQTLLERYEKKRAMLNRPERRRVLNLFKRVSDSLPKEEARKAAENLRQRVLAGESFELLAGEYSDSETRHDQGSLGFISRGKFPKDFDDVVFALEPGVPSDVIMTADGAHLFLVSNVLEARSLDYESSKPLLLQELKSEARLKHLREVADTLPLPAESIVLDHQSLMAAMRSGDPDTPVLKIGEFVILADELKSQIEALAQQLGPKRTPGLPFALLDEIRCRELIYQYASADSSFEPPTERIEAEARRQLIDHHVKEKLRRQLEADAERIQKHYDDNKMRFSTPLQVRIQRLTVPLNPHATEVMAELEEARIALDHGDLKLESMAEFLDGSVREIGPVHAGQLQAVDRRSLQFAFVLKPGEHSPPYQLGSSIVMFKVLERFAPQPLPFTDAQGRVVEDLLKHQSGKVFTELMQSTLSDADFKIYPEAIAAISPPASGSQP